MEQILVLPVEPNGQIRIPKVVRKAANWDESTKEYTCYIKTDTKEITIKPGGLQSNE